MGIFNCTSLYKTYGQTQALSNVNLNVESGRIVGLLGPNGSGKTTLLKLAAGLLVPTAGHIGVDGKAIGTETKSVVSYLPERTYLNNWMSASEIINFMSDFYPDFDKERAFDMLKQLGVSPTDKLATMSKGTKEKIQLVLVMSRNAKLYLLDEPIGGVDPAARDYILNTIISNYRQTSTIIISTHLIYDIENVLDDVIFLGGGNVILQSSVDDIRERQQKSVDTLFREVFRC